MKNAFDRIKKQFNKIYDVTMYYNVYLAIYNVSKLYGVLV